jgi:hypothetical protein
MESPVPAPDCHAEFEPVEWFKPLWIILLAIIILPGFMAVWTVLQGAGPFMIPFAPSVFYAIVVWYGGSRLSSKIRLNECGLSIRSQLTKADIRWKAIDVIVDHKMFGMSLQCGNFWVYIPPIITDYHLLRSYIKLLSPNAKVLPCPAPLALESNSSTNSDCGQD